MSNKAKQKEITEKVEEKQVPFEKHLKNVVKQNTEQFYQDILKQADEKIQTQEKQIRNIQSQQVEFRDEIAIRCFIPLIPLISGSDNYRQAATDAYRAADDFLRIREGAEVE